MKNQPFPSFIRGAVAALLAAVPPVLPASADTILSQNFSTDPVNYTLPGTSSPFRATNTNIFWAVTGTLGITAPSGITGADGAYLAVQNNDGLTNPFSTTAPAQLDFTVSVSGFTDLRLSVALAAMPGAENINFMRAKTDNNGDGTYETTIFNFTSPGPDNQPYTDAVIPLGALSAAFQTKSDIVLPAPTAPDGNLRLRFEFFNDSNTVPSAEATGIDTIVISGTAIPSANSVAAGDWHNPATWSSGAVPTVMTPVTVSHAVTVTSEAAICASLAVNAGGSVSVSGQNLTLGSGSATALATTAGSLSLNGSASLTVPKATTSASLAGLTVAAGAALNITNELTVDANKTLTGATITTPKLTLAGGTLTKADGLAIGSGSVLSGNGTVAGVVTVGSGGKIGPATDTTINNISVQGLTLASGSLLTINASNTTTLDQITVTGSNGLTINGGAVTLLDGTGTAPLTTNGIYNLISYSGAIGGTGPSAMGVGNSVAGKRYVFGTAGGYVTVTLQQGPLWSGPAGGVWSLAANWSGVSPGASDTLVYAAAGTSGSSVNDLTGASFPSIQFESGVNAFTLSGNKVILTGDVNGVVVLNNSSNTQTLNLPLEINASSAVNTVSGAVVIGGNVTGTGTLVKSGTNALTLSGSNEHSGGVTLDAGTLNLNSAGALGDSAGVFTINGGTINNNSAGAVVVAGSNPVTWNADFTFTGTQDLNLGTGAVTMVGARTATVSAKNLTLGGPLSGAAAFTKRGTGTLVLGGAGSSVLKVQVYGGGTLQVASGGGITSTSTLDLVENSTLRVSSGSFTSGGADEAHDGQIGKVIVEGTGTLVSNGEWLMGRNMGRGSLIVRDDAVVSGGLNTLRMGRDNIRDNYVSLRNNAQATFGSVVVFDTSYYGEGGQGSGSVLEVLDNSTLTTSSMVVANFLGNNNTVHPRYGNGQVYQAGTSVVTVNGNISMGVSVPQAEDVIIGTYNLNGGELKCRQINNGTGAIPGTANVNLRGGKLTYNDTVAQTDFIKLGAKGSLYIYEGTTIDDGGQTVTINQPLLTPNSGQGLSSITLAAPIGAVNAYPVNPEVLVTGGGGSGATAVSVLNASGQVSGIIVTSPGLNYTSTPTVQLFSNGGATNVSPSAITLATNAFTGGLTKQGFGTLVLTADNTYTGTTTVETGALKVSNATGSATGTGPVVVNSGATLSGTGTVAGVVTNNGTVSPGASIGILTAGGATFQPGSSLQMEFSPDGSPQIETATAVGDALYDGIVLVTVSGADFVPDVVLNVPVLANDTTVQWAAKVRAALAANATVTALYTVGGSGAEITLTRTVPAAYDPTLNIALDYGDPDPWITPSLTSADTSTGGPGGVDSLVLNGPLVINGGTLDLVVNGTPSDPAYVLITYTGTPPAGVFSAVNNLPAGYIVDYDYGGNSVALVPGTVTDAYLSWLGPYNLTGANRAPGADPDKDGYDNGVEFMTGSSPVSSTSRPANLVTRNPVTGNLVVSFQRVDAAEAYPVVVEHGSTLQAPWSEIAVPNGETAGPPVTVVDNGASPDSVTVIVTGPPATKKFARVRITIPYTP